MARRKTEEGNELTQAGDQPETVIQQPPEMVLAAVPSEILAAIPVPSKRGRKWAVRANLPQRVRAGIRFNDTEQILSEEELGAEKWAMIQADPYLTKRAV